MAENKIGTKLHEKYVKMKEAINLIDESRKFDSGLIRGQYLNALDLLKPNLGETIAYKLPLEMNKHAHIIYLTRTGEDELTVLYIDPERELHNILTGKIAKESSSLNVKLEAKINLNTGEYRIENLGEEIPLEYQGIGMRSIMNDLERILSGFSEGGNGPTITENEPEPHVSFVIHDGISKQRLKALAHLKQLSLRPKDTKEEKEKIKFFVENIWFKDLRKYKKLNVDQRESLKAFLRSFTEQGLKQMESDLERINGSDYIDEFVKNIDINKIDLYKKRITKIAELKEKQSYHRELAEEKIKEPLQQMNQFVHINPELGSEWSEKAAKLKILPENYLRAVKILNPLNEGESRSFTLIIAMNKHFHRIKITNMPKNKVLMEIFDDESNLINPLTKEKTRRSSSRHGHLQILINMDSGKFKILNKKDKPISKPTDIFKQLERILKGLSMGANGPVYTDEANQVHYILHEDLQDFHLPALAELKNVKTGSIRGII